MALITITETTTRTVEINDTLLQKYQEARTRTGNSKKATLTQRNNAITTFTTALQSAPTIHTETINQKWEIA